MRDVTEVLARLDPIATRHPLPLRIAYHDACHLSHGQKVRAQPRALLQAIPGVELVEIPDGDQCCGSAGVYNLVQPESADVIGRRKAEAVLSTGANVLASANPGCTLHVARLLAERGARIEAAHPLELLDRAIGAAPQDAEKLPRKP